MLGWKVIPGETVDEDEVCGFVTEDARGIRRECTERRYRVYHTSTGPKARPREWFFYLGIER
jgi:hypothetical protein